MVSYYSNRNPSNTVSSVPTHIQSLVYPQSIFHSWSLCQSIILGLFSLLLRFLQEHPKWPCQGQTHSHLCSRLATQASPLANFCCFSLSEMKSVQTQMCTQHLFLFHLLPCITMLWVLANRNTILFHNSILTYYIVSQALHPRNAKFFFFVHFMFFFRYFFLSVLCTMWALGDTEVAMPSAYHIVGSH